jgi:hypothetical protein
LGSDHNDELSGAWATVEVADVVVAEDVDDAEVWAAAVEDEDVDDDEDVLEPPPPHAAIAMVRTAATATGAVRLSSLLVIPLSLT